MKCEVLLQHSKCVENCFLIYAGCIIFRSSLNYVEGRKNGRKKLHFFQITTILLNFAQFTVSRYSRFSNFADDFEPFIKSMQIECLAQMVNFISFSIKFIIRFSIKFIRNWVFFFKRFILMKMRPLVFDILLWNVLICILLWRKSPRIVLKWKIYILTY